MDFQKSVGTLYWYRQTLHVMAYITLLDLQWLSPMIGCSFPVVVEMILSVRVMFSHWLQLRCMHGRDLLFVLIRGGLEDVSMSRRFLARL